MVVNGLGLAFVVVLLRLSLILVLLMLDCCYAQAFLVFVWILGWALVVQLPLSQSVIHLMGLTLGMQTTRVQFPCD